MTKDQERIIRDARYQERQERNTPWSEPAVTTPRRTDTKILDDAADDFPGYPNLRRHAQSDRYGKMELLGVNRTSDGFLIGWARVHIGEDNEHEHSVFIG